MKSMFSLVLLFMSLANFAASEGFPSGCKPIVVQEETLKLAFKKPTLIMIHNLSMVDLWVTHPVSDPSASAGWSSRLQTGNWSALALEGKPFELSCIESKPGHEQQIPCASVLAACQWPTVSIPKAESGTFWAGEDMSLNALKAHVGGRGFTLPQESQVNSE